MESREEEINIYLKVTKTVAVKVKTSETVENLKSILREKEGISENFQELFFNGEQLTDDRKLVDYGIQKNSSLHLVLDIVKVTVNIPSRQRSFELEVKSRDTIQNVKSLIQAKEGIQSDCYSLFYGGKLSEDTRTLTSLKIQTECVLYLVFKPKDMVSISVKMPTGETVKAKVKILYTVHEIKAIIGSKVGLSVSDHRLIYARQQLEDWKTLACYNIREDSILKMLPSTYSTFSIFVKDWSGKNVVLDVHRQDTIRDVKNLILNKLRTPVDVQSLVFAGKLLLDDRELASYNIQKDSTLNMVLRLATRVVQMKLSEVGGPIPGFPNATSSTTILPSSTTVRDLKAIIQRNEKTRVKEICVRGIALQDHLSLADYAIEQGTALTIAFEVR